MTMSNKDIDLVNSKLTYNKVSKTRTLYTFILPLKSCVFTLYSAIESTGAMVRKSLQTCHFPYVNFIYSSYVLCLHLYTSFEVVF